MNQDKIQYILIGILMAGMFAIGTGVFVMSQQIGIISDSIKTIEQGMAGSSANSSMQLCLSSGGEYQNNVCYCGKDYLLENGSCMGQDGLTKKEIEAIKARQERIIEGSRYDSPKAVGVSFDYPKGWFVEEYAWDTDGGTNSVKLTSSQGSLEAAISAGGPICSTQICFQQGLQLDVRPLIAETTKALNSGELTRLRTVYPGIDSVNGCDGAGCPSQWYVLMCPNGGKEIRVTYTDSSYATSVDEILKSFSAYCQ
jgi:hypothetical protein